MPENDGFSVELVDLELKLKSKEMNTFEGVTTLQWVPSADDW